jgi:hypothetical protein
MRTFAAIAALAAAFAWALAPGDIAPFSRASPGGAFPAGWQEVGIARNKMPEMALVADEAGVSVLRSRAQSAVGTLAFALDASAQERPVLSWRWKVDHALEAADMSLKSGEDFAARVYVFFDIPLEELPLAVRAKIRLARFLYGPMVPAASVCYVWDNRHLPGQSAWSPFTDRVRVVVLQSGNALAGQWQTERRDLEADFRAAFGETWKKPVPRISGVAAGNDTDQTGETVTAWFGDFALEPRK